MTLMERYFYGWRRWTMTVDIGGPFAGRVCVGWGPWTLHIGVERDHWTWGYDHDWYDGDIHSFGAGPIALLNYCTAVHCDLLRGEE